MYGIEILMNEHKNIFNFTNILENKLIDIVDGGEINTDYFRKCISFIRNYADKHHHQKEEGLLFVKMTEELGETAEKLIRSGMLVEHDLARFTTGEWEKSLAAYDEDPSSKNKLDILAHGMNYVYLLRRHATKEDDVLYPFAERHLSQESKDWLDAETKRMEDEAEGLEEFKEFFV